VQPRRHTRQRKVKDSRLTTSPPSRMIIAATKKYERTERKFETSETCETLKINPTQRYRESSRVSTYFDPWWYLDLKGKLAIRYGLIYAPSGCSMRSGWVRCRLCVHSVNSVVNSENKDATKITRLGLSQLCHDDLRIQFPQVSVPLRL
jgi:hypothetical protein